MNERQARILNLISHNALNPVGRRHLSRLLAEMIVLQDKLQADARGERAKIKLRGREGRLTPSQERLKRRDELTDEIAQEWSMLMRAGLVANVPNMVKGGELAVDGDNRLDALTEAGWEALQAWKADNREAMKAWQKWERDDGAVAPAPEPEDPHGRPIIMIPPLRPQSREDFIVRVHLTALDELYLKRRCYRTGEQSAEGAIQHMLGHLERDRGDTLVTGKPLPAAGPPKLGPLSETMIKRLRGYNYLDEEVAREVLSQVAFRATREGKLVGSGPKLTSTIDARLNNFERMALDNQQACNPVAYGLSDGEAVVALVRREEETLAAIAERVAAFIAECLDDDEAARAPEARKLISVIPAPFLAKYQATHLIRKTVAS